MTEPEMVQAAGDLPANPVGAVLRLLAVRYAPPEWLLCHEVGANVYRRRADAVAFNLWSSRGYCLEGFEVKVDRRDWRNELRNPAKAEESVFRYMDRWWLVTAPNVAALEEIPVPWGWLERTGNRLYTRKKAPALTPQAVTRPLMAALVKRFMGGEGDERRQLQEEAYERAKASRSEADAHEMALLTAEIKTKDQELAAFRTRYGWASGEEADRAIRLAQLLVSTHYRSGTLGAINTALVRSREAVGDLEKVAAFLYGLGVADG